MASADLTEKLRARDAIVQELVDQIESGVLEPGSKLKATQHLAKHFGVATNTAQAAVAELCQRGLVNRRPGRGTVVTSDAAERVSQKACVVALELQCHGVIHIWGDFTQVLLHGLRELPVQPVLFDSSGIREHEVTALPGYASLMESKPRIIVAQHRHAAMDARRRCPNAHIICLEPLPSGEWAHDVVVPGYEQVGCLAAEHLISCGYKRPACFVVNVNSENNDGIFIRQEARDALAGFQGILAKNRMPEAEIIRFRMGDNAGEVLAQRLKEDNPPDAIFCPLTHRAMEVVKHFRKIGISIPDDIAIICGSNTPIAAEYDLTTLDLRYDLIARYCLDTIKRVLNGERVSNQLNVHTVLPDLVIRSSTRKLRS